MIADRAGDIEADVVVVGGGAAGLMAAIEAADAGLRTMLLESEPSPGGSTALSAGHASLCETVLEPASRDQLLADLVAAHHGDGDHSLSEVYAAEAGETFRRLHDLGVVFARTVKLSHMGQSWAHEMPLSDMGGGAQIAAGLHRAALARGVQVRVEHRARRLIREDGRAAGVAVDTTRGRLSVLARRGIVLATGGFTRNPDLVKHFGPPGMDRLVPITGAGSRGDGLLMGMALGAGTAGLTVGIAPTVPTDPLTGKGVLMIYAGAILLNRQGRRFYRESELYNDISKAGLQQDSDLMIQLYDSRIKQHFAGTMWSRALTGFVEHGNATLDGLLQELSQVCSLDAIQASRTIADYNRSLPDDDELGRRHLVGTSGMPTPLQHPPFFAAVTRPGTTHFNGGLRIDKAMRVLDVFGDVIPGLYAAGEIAGGFHGSGYLSGTHVGMALVFGRLAGRSAGSIGKEIRQ